MPKVEESVFSANHFLLKLIVPRAQPSTPAQTDHPYATKKSQVWNNTWAINIYGVSHSPRRRLYPPAWKPYGLEAEPEARRALVHFKF